jgi:hypothetical protein
VEYRHSGFRRVAESLAYAVILLGGASLVIVAAVTFAAGRPSAAMLGSTARVRRAAVVKIASELTAFARTTAAALPGNTGPAL